MSTPPEVVDQYPRAGIYVEKDDSWEEHSWTAVPNILLRNPALSWDAKAAYGWLASHSKKFTLKAESLAEAGPKGRNHARDMLRELEEHGWLTRSKRRNSATGRYDVFVYRLHPIPVPEEARTFTESTAKERKFPQVKPATGRAGAGQAEDRGLFGEEFEQALNPQVRPETDRSGAGQPGAGQPGTGQADASRARLSVTKKTTEGDQKERECTPEAEWMADPDGDPDVFMRQADIDAERRRTNRRNGSAVAMNDTARSQPAIRIVRDFAESLPRKLPNSELIKLAKGIDEAFGLDWTESEIWQGLKHWESKPRCGAGLFVQVASEVVCRNPVQKRASTDVKFDQNLARHQAMTGGVEDPADVAASLFPAVAAASRARREELENSTNHPSSTTRALPAASA